MGILRVIRIAAIASIAALVTTVGISLLLMPSAKQQVEPAPIGGPFALVDQDGNKVTDKDFAGKPSVIFFGYTSCPDVCPTTLLNLSNWLKAIGPDAEKLNVLFISVDPERDTPAHLKEYLSSFDPRIRGLTGTDDQVAAVAKAYRVYYKRIPGEDGGYTMDHSSAIYLMDRAGQFVAPLASQTDERIALERLRKLAAS